MAQDEFIGVPGQSIDVPQRQAGDLGGLGRPLGQLRLQRLENRLEKVVPIISVVKPVGVLGRKFAPSP